MNGRRAGWPPHPALMFNRPSPADRHARQGATRCGSGERCGAPCQVWKTAARKTAAWEPGADGARRSSAAVQTGRRAGGLVGRLWHVRWQPLSTSTAARSCGRRS